MLDPRVPDDNKTRAEFLENILSSGRHLLGLINDVLDLSKVEAGRMELHPEELDVAAALEGVQAVIKPLVDQKRQRLELQVDPAVGTIYHDPARFKQVLWLCP